MSTLPPECQQLLISGYVLGNLSPAEALLFAEMLQENPQLQEEVTLMQQALDRAYTPLEVSPPPALRDRLLSVAKTQQAIPTPTAKTDSTTNVSDAESFDSSVFGKLLGAIAIAIIAVLSIVNYRLWQTSQTNQKNLEISQNTYLLSGKDLPETASAKLIVNQDQLKGTLITNSLPSLPPEKVYALWTVVGKNVPYTTDEKGAILTAVFKVDELGNFAQEIALPQPHLEPRAISKIAITIEDLAAPQAHTGSILLSTGNKL